MGGRGSSSGASDKGKPYGSEYTTVMKIRLKSVLLNR